jgi:hypothetical protein
MVNGGKRASRQGSFKQKKSNKKTFQIKNVFPHINTLSNLQGRLSIISASLQAKGSQ